MFEKIKNFFIPKRRNSTSSKDLNKVSNGVTNDNLKKYKTLIPNLIDEFLDDNSLKKKRTNSFTEKNIKLTLYEKKITHSNTQSLFKLRKKRIPQKTDLNISLGKHYFKGSVDQETKNLTTKNLRRSSIIEKKGEIIKEEDENENLDNKNISVKRTKKKKENIRS